ncbi:MAG: penicillin-binding protein [Candidatus Dojkabacteria bacterium]|nr:MAG: penicillin-binding protein [Candidatus Dojkabacteria bacterium]
MKYNMGFTDHNPTGAHASRRMRRPSPRRIRASSVAAHKRSSAHNYKSPGNISHSASRTSGRSTMRRFNSMTNIGQLWNGFVGKKPKSSGRPSAGAKNRKLFFKRLFAYMFGFAFVTTAIAFIALGIYLKGLQQSLPDPDKLIERDVAGSTIIYDRTGKKELFKVYSEENREFVDLEDIPEHTKWALLAAEDVEFYEHKGLDWKGITSCGIKSTRSYLTGSGDVCGASTISQQLVRNTLCYEAFGDECYERSNFLKAARRKLKEMLLTMQVEQTFTKDEILQLYMNEVFMGSVNYGFQSASKAYFGKDIRDLTLAESAMLAGMIQSPTYYAPIYGVEQEGAKVRQAYVLDQMSKHKKLTGVSEEELQAAAEEEIVYKTLTNDIPAYHFVFYVQQQLEQEFGHEMLTRGGLKVTTTLDMSTQIVAEEEIRNGIKQYGNKWGVYNGALVAIDPNTGQILAMVGSVDPTITDDPRIDGNVNVTTALRQQGSSVKSYTYFTAFQRWGPWMSAPDIAEMSFGNYNPPNWDTKTLGIMTAREALVKSRNRPAVYTLQAVGLENVMANMEKMGITTLGDPSNYGLSFTLGTAEMSLLEHAGAYSIFATGGIKRDVTPFLKVENSKGEVLKEYEEKSERIFSEEDIYLLNWTLCDLGAHSDQIMRSAPQYYYNIGGKPAICGKTGTTNGPKDLVSMQYHKNLVVGVWAGNNNGEEVPGAWSTTVPLPIAHSFMERVSSKYPSQLYSRPANVSEGQVCRDTGRLASDSTPCSKEKTVYVNSRKPGEDKRETAHICRSNGKIASNYNQASQFPDILEDKTWLNFTPENGAQLGTIAAFFDNLETDGRRMFVFNQPESANCDLPLGPNGEPVPTITSPATGSSIDAGEQLVVDVDVRFTGSLNYVELLIDGSPVDIEDDSSPYQLRYTVPSGRVAGNMLVTARAVDSAGRIGTTSINVTVTGNAGSLNWVTPTNNQTISIPHALEVTASGFTPLSVTFVIQGVDVDYTRTYTDNSSNGGWSVNWNDIGAGDGEYTVTARSVSGTTIIVSEITIRVN